MRIYGDYAKYGDFQFLAKKLKIKFQSDANIYQNTTPITQIDFSNIVKVKLTSNQQDQIQISQMGRDYLQESMNPLEINGDKTSRLDGLSVLDRVCMSYIMRNLAGDSYSDMKHLYQQQQSMQTDSADLNGYADSLKYAYETMYDGIVQGYADGTREVWIQVEDIEGNLDGTFQGLEFGTGDSVIRYRKLTMEEELERLDQAFDRLSEFAANQYAQANVADAEDTDSEECSLQKSLENLIAKAKELFETLKKALLKKKEENPAEKIKARLVQESAAHIQQTVSERNRRTQHEQYVKVSKMALDAATMLGNLHLYG